MVQTTQVEPAFVLRNVVANYHFERSHRFAGIQPNPDLIDHSRLSCGELERLASFLRDKIILQFQSHKCSQFYSDRRANQPAVRHPYLFRSDNHGQAMDAISAEMRPSAPSAHATSQAGQLRLGGARALPTANLARTHLPRCRTSVSAQMWLTP